MMNNEDLELIENRLMIATCFIMIWVCFVMLPLNILRGYPAIYIIVLVGFQLSVAIGTSFQQSLLRKQFITPYSMCIRSFQLYDLFALNFLFIRWGRRNQNIGINMKVLYLEQFIVPLLLRSG